MVNISIRYSKGGDIIDKFNARHLGFIILGVSIVSLKTYPSLMTRNGGRDSWITLIIASIIIFLYAWFMLSSFKKTNTFNLYNIYCGALGKFWGNFLLILFAITLFLSLVESASVEANSMHTNMLFEVPSWYILIFFVCPALYTIKKGKAALIITTVISMVLIIISGINLSILTIKYKKLYYLLPILKDGIRPDIIKSFLQFLGLYGCFTIAFAYIEDIQDKNKIVRTSLISLIFIIQMQIISIMGIITTFEIRYLNTMPYPKLLQTQLVELSGFMESGEFFVMLQILGGWYIKYVLTFYALMKILKDLKIYDKYTIYTSSLLVLIAGLALSQDTFNLFRFLNYYTYICLVNFVIIPFIMMLIFRIRTVQKNRGQ